MIIPKVFSIQALAAICVVGFSYIAFSDDKLSPDPQTLGNNVTNEGVTKSNAAEPLSEPKSMAPTPDVPTTPFDPIDSPIENAVELEPNGVAKELESKDSSNGDLDNGLKNSAQSDGSGKVMLQSVMIVNLPSADASIVDNVVNAHNEKNFDKLSKAFNQDGFVFITPDFKTINSIDELESEWDKMINGISVKDVKINSTVDSVKDLAPGIGILTGRINVELGVDKTLDNKFTMTARYVNDEWKIIQLHVSSKDVIEMVLESEKVEPIFDIMIIAYTILGLLVGFILAKVVVTRKSQQ